MHGHLNVKTVTEIWARWPRHGVRYPAERRHVSTQHNIHTGH